MVICGQVKEVTRLSYKIDFSILEMVDELIHKILSGEHKEDDVQKDIVLAQRGLNMIVDDMVKKKIDSITKAKELKN